MHAFTSGERGESRVQYSRCPAVALCHVGSVGYTLVQILSFVDPSVPVFLSHVGPVGYIAAVPMLSFAVSLVPLW